MPSVYRVTMLWSGFQGAPGYSRFSFSDLNTTTSVNSGGSSVRAFFAGLAPFIPPSVALQVQPGVQEYDAATSTLVGEQTMSIVPAVLNGSGTATPYAAGSGFVVTWNTGSIFAGRRVQGRTFIVPAIDCFQSDGSLSSGAIGTIQTAINTFIGTAGSDFAVWAKSWTKQQIVNNAIVPPHQTGGSVFSVSAGVVKDAASQMRSRRT